MSRHSISTYLTPDPAPGMWDLIILGAGCTGLSLVNELLDQQPTAGPSVLLLEARTEHLQDRTWCYWDTMPHRFEHVASHRWNRWSVRHAGEEVRCHGSFSYHYLRSEDFYQAALKPLQQASRVSLRMGEPVVRLEETAGALNVQTLTGSFSGRRVIDTRPAPPPRSSPAHVQWFQHFAGWHVQTVEDCFDESCVTLMDFDAGQRLARRRQGGAGDGSEKRLPGVPFLYVLPFSCKQALVEVTWFGPEPFSPDIYQAQLQEYLDVLTGESGRFEILEQESGVLPMFTEPPCMQPSPRLIRLGLGGGAARPSTGYAFLAIQRQARLMARYLLQNQWGTPPAYYSPGSRWLDHTFLHVLQATPPHAPRLFFQMFQQSAPDALVRFLSDTGSLRDLWRVIHHLPLPTFLKQGTHSAQQILRETWGEPSLRKEPSC